MIGAADLAAAMTETNVSQRALAEHLGVSRAVVEQLLDGRKPVSLDLLERAPAGLAVRVLRRALARAEQRCEGRRGPLDLLTHTSKVSEAAADVVRVVCDVLADGRLDDHERPMVARAVRLTAAGEHLVWQMGAAGTKGSR